ncbi:MAG: type II restriction endonuclease [Coriobacteriales bacterium]|jgi:type II restriction enzyme|nr:type II restriction endonuclease [Coriobacteriales bacterium]
MPTDDSAFETTYLAERAIQAVNTGTIAYCKFLSANDTGDTGGHQSGIYIAKNALTILFDRPQMRGDNSERFVNIRWQDDFDTESRFIYYGAGTRNEYRITRFQKGFPFLSTEHTGDLFVFVKRDEEHYQAYILSTEDEIDSFLGHYGMSPSDTGTLISAGVPGDEDQLEAGIREFIASLTVEFPDTKDMAFAAQDIEARVFGHADDPRADPDQKLLAWIGTEYTLFKRLEQDRYGDLISKGFSSVEEFVVLANSVLNKRKSRAGKSLEHHLAHIFDLNDLRYSAQPRTEGNKHPDFIFPNEAAYHTHGYPLEKLVVLAAKTSCKDRWRQVINEADLFKGRDTMKHLFTLQQGISVSQLKEMEEEGVVLVVPKPYISTYPASMRDRIWTLKRFIDYVKKTTSL